MSMMISIAPDVLNRLMALRLSESEPIDEVFRRYLGNIPKPPAKAPAQSAGAKPKAKPRRLTYQLLGETHSASEATEAMINILRELAQYDDDFFPKLAPKIRGRTRNHIAQSRSEVYPGRPDLTGSVQAVVPGWFIGCNIANREKENILSAACDVMGLVFGRDLKIDLMHG